MDRTGKLIHPGWCENLLRAGRLQPGERVLVVVDEPLVEEGSQLLAAAKDAGAEPRLELWAGERPLGDLPGPVRGAAREADLTLFLQHTLLGNEASVRAELYAEATADHGRELFLGFVDGDLLRSELSEPGPDLSAEAAQLLGRLEGTKTVRVRGQAGTDLTLQVTGRRWLTDALALQPGGFANYPGGEVFVAPLADGADGVVVADLTVPYTVEGLVDAPVALRFEHGRVTSIDGGRAAALLRELVESAGPGGDVIAELGIGLNSTITPRGHVMLDEKAAATAHVAIGANRAHGGDNDATIHVDCIFSGPSLEADGRAVQLP